MGKSGYCLTRLWRGQLFYVKRWNRRFYALLGIKIAGCTKLDR